MPVAGSIITRRWPKISRFQSRLPLQIGVLAALGLPPWYPERTVDTLNEGLPLVLR